MTFSSFSSFDLLPEILQAVQEKGYQDPKPIQQEAIPLIMQGCDLIAKSQTGSGKTAAFVLSLLHNIMKRKPLPPKKGPPAPRALILTPTRELAVQVEESVRDFSKHLPLKSIAVFGGMDIQKQYYRLKRGIDVVVATPGRLLDLIQNRMLTLEDVSIVVMDEADRMLDMGFIHDIRDILSQVQGQPDCQTLLFSATFSKEVKKLAQEFLVNPKTIEMATENITLDTITQSMHIVDNKDKQRALTWILKERHDQQILVFTSTKHNADRLVLQLEKGGVSAKAIHGDKTQGARLKTLTSFKRGEVRVLVATDVVARGLDIQQLPLVINYELPRSPEDYVHRIGRTGRAGHLGEAISLVSREEKRSLKFIEHLLKREIPKKPFPINF